MSQTVDAIMNPEVYTVRTQETTGEVLAMILTLGITAAPVVDEQDVPLGLVSLRNLARANRDDPVARHMTTPAATIPVTTTVEDAGRQMGQLSYHHLVVVDALGRVTGFVSSLDVIRGLVGLPSSHPPAFLQQEPEGGLAWSDTTPLTAAHVAEITHEGPGMLVLVRTGREAPSSEVVWAEACKNVAARLRALLSGEHELPDFIAEYLAAGTLTFRVASFAGPETDGPSVIDVLLER